MTIQAEIKFIDQIGVEITPKSKVIIDSLPKLKNTSTTIYHNNLPYVSQGPEQWFDIKIVYCYIDDGAKILCEKFSKSKFPDWPCGTLSANKVVGSDPGTVDDFFTAFSFPFARLYCGSHKWDLEKCFVTGFTIGDTDYFKGDFSSLFEMTVKFNDAELIN